MGHRGDELGLHPHELFRLLPRGPLVDHGLLDADAPQVEPELPGQCFQEVEVFAGPAVARELRTESEQAFGRSRRLRQGQDDLSAGRGQVILPFEIEPFDDPDPAGSGPDPSLFERELLDDRGRRRIQAVYPARSLRARPGLPEKKAPSLGGQDPFQRAGIEGDEIVFPDDGGRRGLEGLNGPPVIVALPEEQPVDDVLDRAAARAQGQGDDGRRGHGDDGVAGRRRPREQPPQRFDREKKSPQREDRQDGIDEAAMEDDVDPQQPELEDGHDHEDRDEQKKEKGEILGEERMVHEHQRQLVEGQERPQPGGEADQVPLDLGPVLIGGRVPEGPGELEKGREAGDDDVEPEDMLDRLPEAVGGQRRRRLGDEVGDREEQAPNDGDDPVDGRRDAAPDRAVALGEPQQQGQGHRVGHVEQDAGQEMGRPALEPVRASADDDRGAEAQAEPIEEPGPAVARPEEEHDEPGQKARQSHQDQGQGERPLGIIRDDGVADEGRASVRPETDLDRIADGLAAEGEADARDVGRAPDLEAVDADDRPGEVLGADRRPAGQIDQAEHGHGEEDRPAEKRAGEGARRHPLRGHGRPDYISRGVFYRILTSA